MRQFVFSRQSRNALTALSLCLFFYLLLPFVIKEYFPAAVDFLSGCKVLPAAVSVAIVLILGVIGRSFFFSVNDFTNVPYFKIVLYNILMLIICAPAAFAWTELLDLFKIKYDMIVPAEELIKTSHGIELVFLGIFVCLLVPLAEEIIFRRVIFEGAAEVLPPVCSMAVTSLIFALLHGIIFQLLPLFMLGFYFQILYCRYGKLGVSFFAHALNNTFAFAVILLMRAA